MADPIASSGNEMEKYFSQGVQNNVMEPPRTSGRWWKKSE
jgi:hypothetical protein